MNLGLSEKVENGNQEDGIVSCKYELIALFYSLLN